MSEMYTGEWRYATHDEIEKEIALLQPIADDLYGSIPAMTHATLKIKILKKIVAELYPVGSVPCKTLKELLVECKRCGPLDYNDPKIRNMSQNDRRWDCIARLGFHIPTLETVSAMTKFACRNGESTLLSIGSGVGTTEKLMQLYASEKKLPLTVIATDPWLSHDTTDAKALIKTHAMDGVTAVSEYHTDGLLLSWPSYDSPIAANVLKAFMKTNGKFVIYIGEGHGGCTADDEFHDLLDEHWDLQSCLTDAPCWWGIHDAPHLYTQKVSSNDYTKSGSPSSPVPGKVNTFPFNIVCGPPGSLVPGDVNTSDIDNIESDNIKSGDTKMSGYPSGSVLNTYHTCEKCSNSSGASSFMCCARCKNARYCSRTCQKTHWKTHKSVCVLEVKTIPGIKHSVQSLKRFTHHNLL
jgi:hypothetical protein